MPEIVLASASPRRAELIKMLGITDIAVIPSQVSEIMPEGKSPEETVCTLALAKAQSVAATVVHGQPLIIAADTLVYIDNRPLGKPIDAEDAAAMLRALSGRCHSVYTGIALLRDGKHITGAERTDVWFREITDDEIAAYVASGEPMDKAGAYAAQGGAAIFTERIEGDFWNVVGLPLCRLSVMLKEFEAICSCF